MNHLPFQSPGRLTKDLLRYWTHHPEAQGTVEAIAEWWLLEQRIQETVTEVRSGLAELVAQGLVVEQPRADGQICYRLNRKKESEIRRWLESRPKGEATENGAGSNL